MTDGLTVHRHTPGGGAADPGRPVFYYDFVVPGCYPIAERMLGDLPVVPDFSPVRAAALPGAPARPDPVDVDAFAERLAAQGLQPLRWPPAWPWDPEPALLAATYAASIGRSIAFTLAAFRQAYAGGRDLADPDSVVIAAAANEMHPRAVLKGMGLRAVAAALDAATDAAAGHGVAALPALRIGGRVIAGEADIAAAITESTR